MNELINNRLTQEIINDFLEIKELYDNKKRIYDKLIKGVIRDGMKEQGIKRLPFGDKHVIIYTPPRQYPSLKKEFTMDAVYLELPHMFDLKSGYESTKMVKKENLREEN